MRIDELKTAVTWTLGLAAVFGLHACANSEPPTKWTLWYAPGQERAIVAARGSCRTYVFATPAQTEYAVAVLKGWDGSKPPAGPEQTLYSGENIDGSLELGSRSVHDESNGHDLNVDVVYRVQAYVPAKLRADTLCSVGQRATSARSASRASNVSPHPPSSPAPRSTITAARHP